LADPNTTLVSEDTFKLAEGLFRFEALGKRFVKGEEKPVSVYQVIAPSSMQTRLDVSAERGLTPICWPGRGSRIGRLKRSNEMNSTSVKKPLKDKDARTAIQFVQVYLYLYLVSAIISILITRSFILGILLASVLNIILTYIVIYFLDRTAGGFANMLYGTGRKTITPHERLESDMQQATYYKNSNDYEKAKKFVDQVLEKEPDHAEALFLKSKIVYEGFGDPLEAKKILYEIFKIGPDKAPTIHNWATYFYKEINRKERALNNMTSD